MDSPLDSAATVLLLFLGLVVLRNWRAGTLGQWAKAKFLLQTTSTSAAGGTGGDLTQPGAASGAAGGLNNASPTTPGAPYGGLQGGNPTHAKVTT